MSIGDLPVHALGAGALISAARGIGEDGIGLVERLADRGVRSGDAHPDTVGGCPHTTRVHPDEIAGDRGVRPARDNRRSANAEAVVAIERHVEAEEAGASASDAASDDPVKAKGKGKKGDGK